MALELQPFGQARRCGSSHRAMGRPHARLRGVCSAVCTSGGGDHGSSTAAVVSEATTVIPVLSTEEMLAASRAKRADSDTSHMVALYSSYYGGITTDPAMMMLPLDDHGMSRGHWCATTALLLDQSHSQAGPD
jgi:4-amino-4-deoxychorismate lyase